MIDERPLVSLVIISYNQAAYIRSALAAAFAQTYAPLSIEISDDASSDATFELTRAMCAEYRGPHQVSCTRNPSNLGLAAHVEFVNRRAAGELIVIAAGDDISVPDRVERIVQEYLRGGRRSHYFYSMVRSMTESGELGGAYQSPGADAAQSKLRAAWAAFPLAIGASQAYSRHFVHAFQPMNRRLWAEDQIFGFRGMLLGPVAFIDEPLVNYRSTGISNAPKRWSLQRYVKNQVNVLAVYRQRATDAFTVGERVLGLAILAKLAALTIFFPASPLLSLMRRSQRVRRRQR